MLSYARSIDVNEAVNLLSRLRLGLNRDVGVEMTHEELNRLLIDVQPAHLRRTGPASAEGNGDVARADMLRTRLRNGDGGNRN